jgi:hypothetical protein
MVRTSFALCSIGLVEQLLGLPVQRGVEDDDGGDALSWKNRLTHNLNFETYHVDES